MFATVRSSAVAVILVAVALAGAACTPTSGPLGTPASPAVTPAGSDEPSPSDVAPETPSAVPTDTPSTTPTEAPSSSAAASASPTAVATPKATPAPVGTTLVRAYFILGSFTGNEGLVPVLREVPGTNATARAAMVALLAGPKGAELAGRPAVYSAIPDGTRLLGLAIKNGVATVPVRSPPAAAPTPSRAGSPRSCSP